MRFKVVPPPRGLAVLREVHRALPVVPGRVEDCCARVTRRTDVASRDEAREWLTFCRALELAAETDRGYRRVRDEPDVATLAGRFRERVYGAEEVLSTLAAADGPLAGDALASRLEIPAWERRRHQDPASVWAERVDRLARWAVALDLAAETDAGYTA